MFEIQRQSLSVEDYIEIYTSVGWKVPSVEQIAVAIEKSPFTVCVRYEGKPVGMGRIVGDCAMSFFVKDIAVIPKFQNQGIGSIIMDCIAEYVKKNTPKGWEICMELISAEGKEGFYEKFGFGKKPGNGMGHGMMGLIIGEK